MKEDTEENGRKQGWFRRGRGGDVWDGSESECEQERVCCMISFLKRTDVD